MTIPRLGQGFCVDCMDTFPSSFYYATGERFWHGILFQGSTSDGTGHGGESHCCVAASQIIQILSIVPPEGEPSRHRCIPRSTR